MKGEEPRGGTDRCTALKSSIIAGAEARSRRRRFKEYRRVHHAEGFAERLGVPVVNYGDRLDIANVCNFALFTVFERGVPMPSRLVLKEGFTPQENEEPEEMAYYLPGFGNQPGEIFINADHPAWQNLAEAMARARQNHDLSTDDPRHPIVHEMGELAMHLSVGGDRFDPLNESYLQDEEAFQQLGEAAELDEIADAVSDRAASNHSEFVAEVFAALMLGRVELLENKAVMDAYTRFGGQPIRHYDPHA